MSTQRLSEATEWWLRLREPNVPPQAIGEWMSWCDADPRNAEAFESVQALWQKAGSAPLRPVSTAELEPRRSDGGWRTWAAAAALALIAIGGVYLLGVKRDGVSVEVLSERGAQASSPTGESREFRLADGSRVILGGESGLRTAFTADRREVRLDRGEAFFEVRKDPRRPFVVETLGAAITAVGTAFNIRADGGALRVTVTEGVVDVRPAPDENGQLAPLRLPAGSQVTLIDGKATPGELPRVTPVDPGVAVAWTTGTLKFLDEPLESVVAAVGRYSQQDIELKGEGLAPLRYTGTVVSSRIDEWLRALPNAFPVEVVQEGSGHVRIQARER